MRILYGVQGTGHGHLSRAEVALPILQTYAEVDVLVSGSQKAIDLPARHIRQHRGISFTYDDEGCVSYSRTVRDLHLAQFIKDVRSLSLAGYDLVFSDFEPITAWAAHWAGKPCVAFSHQAAFLSPKAPRPAQPSRLVEGLFHYFAPSTHAVGFHFLQYDSHIEPPIIRPAIRALTPTEGDHVTVYLPGYHDDVLSDVLGSLTETRWEVFSPYTDAPVTRGNVRFHPLSKTRFLDSFAACHGILTGSGFQTSSEALFLGKKLLSVPIANQYEQLCNAAALTQMGVTVLDKVNATRASVIRQWLRTGQVVRLTESADLTTIIPKALRQAFGEPRSKQADRVVVS